MKTKSLATALLGIILLVALPLPALADTIPISVTVSVGADCLLAGTGPADKPVTATLRTNRGHVRGAFRAHTAADGAFGGCFPVLINGGDSIRVKVGGQVKLVDVPRITPRSNRETDVVTIFGPPNSQIDVVVQHRLNLKDYEAHWYTVTTDGNGNYVLDVSADVDLKGFDFVGVRYITNGDTFFAYGPVPGIVAYHADNYVSGQTNNGTNVKVTLADAHGNVKALATAGPVHFGEYEVSLFKANGHAAYPLAGDWLSADFATDAKIQIPVGALLANPSTDVVSGRCPANAKWRLEVYNDTIDEFFFGQVGASGEFARYIGSRVDLAKGDQVELHCLYPTGDEWVDRVMAR